MGTNVLAAAFLKYEIGYYGYSHPSITGHTGFVLGQPLVDCSQLVYDGLLDAGYRPTLDKYGNFNTTLLINDFNSTTNTEFEKIQPVDVTAPNGIGASNPLQMGDIILFKSTTGIDQHTGIFYGYDKDGNPMFYESGSSSGPKITTIKLGDSATYWNGQSFTIIGALRPNESIHTGTDTTTDAVLAITQVVGHGKNIPGQQPDPTAEYRKVYGANGVVMLLYASGEIFSYASTIVDGVVKERAETWWIPNGDGSGTAITRKIFNPGTEQASYGTWQYAGGQPYNAATNTELATQFLVSLRGGDTATINPFLDPATAQEYALADATGSTPPSLTQQAIEVGAGKNTSAITIFTSGASTIDQLIMPLVPESICF